MTNGVETSNARYFSMHTWICIESKETFVGTCKMAQLHIGVDNMGSLKRLVRREYKSAHGWVLSDV